MEGRTTQVSIVVTDQDAALDFYTNKVGFEKKTDISPPGLGRWVTVGPVGDALELALIPLGYRGQGPPPLPLTRAGNTMIIVTVADVPAAYEEMRRRGVTFLGAPLRQPWGTVVAFEDADHNHVTLREAPPRPR